MKDWTFSSSFDNGQDNEIVILMNPILGRCMKQSLELSLESQR